MSWSVSAVGRVAAVKAAVAVQFEAAKKNTANIPQEQAEVGLAEQLVNAQLDFLAEATTPGAVNVQASGSVYLSDIDDKKVRGGSLKVEINQLYGFVE